MRSAPIELWWRNMALGSKSRYRVPGPMVGESRLKNPWLMILLTAHALSQKISPMDQVGSRISSLTLRIDVGTLAVIISLKMNRAAQINAGPPDAKRTPCEAVQAFLPLSESQASFGGLSSMILLAAITDPG